VIQKTKQIWEAGQAVKVGFMSLVVKAAIATPGDYRPDAYLLTNKAGTQLYKFVPHHGLEKVSLVEARELLADSRLNAQRIAAEATAKARSDANAIAAINDLLFAEVA
jgi:hypothetical protein